MYLRRKFSTENKKTFYKWLPCSATKFCYMQRVAGSCLPKVLV